MGGLVTCFTFLLKHMSGYSNWVVDALSRIILSMHESEVEFLGFDFLKNMYEVDLSSHDVFEACRNSVSRVRGT